MEIIINPANKVDASALYDAAMRGDTETLEGLLRSDNLLLKKLPLSSFTETPLHVSVLAGHLDFSRALLRHHPAMAMEVDASNCTPLHLASAAGHAEMVRVLLSAEGGSDACLVRDEDGKIPLHLATMRGRNDVVRELVGARPESLLAKLDDGGTVLHLCVKHNHLESLKVLVDVAESIISSGDEDGNTILHVAAMSKQVQITSYLVSLPSMGAALNSLNRFGSTALDSLELCPKDFKTVRIRDILVEAGGKRAKELSSSITTHHHHHDLPPSQSPSTKILLPISNRQRSKPIMGRQGSKFLDHDVKWVEDMQGWLLVMAVLIAQMSFQAANTPPGGLWQENVSSSVNGRGCNSTSVCYAGTSVHGYRNPGVLFLFMGLNTLAFAASVCVMLMIIAFPQRTKLAVRVMTGAMCVAIACITLAFGVSALLVTPVKDGRHHKVFAAALCILVAGVSVGAWAALMASDSNLEDGGV